VPIEVKELKTKSGHPVLRADFIAEVTVQDARGYHSQLLPGGRYEDFGHLIVGKVSGVSGDVKKVLGSQKPPDPNNPPPVAVLLDSALARMAANLAMRISSNENTEAFKTEQDGLDWLDARMTEYLREKGPTKPR
jgi:hypothetical protein